MRKNWPDLDTMKHDVESDEKLAETGRRQSELEGQEAVPSTSPEEVRNRARCILVHCPMECAAMMR